MRPVLEINTKINKKTINIRRPELFIGFQKTP
jgi:hypothetical protein